MYLKFLKKIGFKLENVNNENRETVSIKKYDFLPLYFKLNWHIFYLLDFFYILNIFNFMFFNNFYYIKILLL